MEQTAVTVRGSNGHGIGSSVDAGTNASILDAIKPFAPDDGLKGTFLVLRIAGIDKGMVLRIINRKYRTWQQWRSTDEYFIELDDRVPELAKRFGGEARVLRTALLDVHIVETGISVFQRILRQVCGDNTGKAKVEVTEGMWAYAVKMAGLRIPMMGQVTETGNPWANLANAIKSTMVQKELVVSQETSGFNGFKTIMAKETRVERVERRDIADEIVVQPSPEQRQMASEIVREMLEQAQGRNEMEKS